jgi:hypothetical protein
MSVAVPTSSGLKELSEHVTEHILLFSNVDTLISEHRLLHWLPRYSSSKARVEKKMILLQLKLPL